MIKKINIKKIFDITEKIDNIYGNYIGKNRCREVKLQTWPRPETNLTEVLLWTN